MVASREARVHSEHHRRLVAATGDGTALTSISGPEFPRFNPMRVQRNRVVSEWDGRLADIPPDLDSLERVGSTVASPGSSWTRPTIAKVAKKAQYVSAAEGGR